MSEITRTEKFLRACIDGEPCALKPLTRVEKLLAELNDKLAGGPSEVVILPETVTEVVEEMDGNAPITTPLSATPTEGATAKVTYNGTEYPCTVAYFNQHSFSTFLLGNIDQMGVPVAGGNPDAPFVVMLSPAGVEGMYGSVIPLDGAPTVTISIVQEGAASGESGGGTEIYTVTAEGKNLNGLQVSNVNKTVGEIIAAVKAGRLVQMLLFVDGIGPYILPLTVYTDELVAFCAKVTAQITYFVQGTPDGFTGAIGN